MRDIPIIFSAPMVRALLDGRKTMTRRMAWWLGVTPPLGWVSPATSWQRVKPSDRLWVRENFSGPHEWGDIPPSGWGWDTMIRPPIWYWADDNPSEGDWTRPKPSIHMPRWASRLTLIVTATKIERLQNISEADAMAEGVERRGHRDYWAGECRGTDPVACFSALWWSLHGIESWNENPEVVALSFQVEKINIDAREAQAA